MRGSPSQAARTATWAAIALGSGVRPLRLRDRCAARARPVPPRSCASVAA